MQAREYLLRHVRRRRRPRPRRDAGRRAQGFGEGRALLSADAKAAGLVDRISTVDDTVRRLVGKSASLTRAADTASRIGEF